MDEKGEYYITNATGLLWVANQVNNKINTFSKKTIKLANDIDLINIDWTPIGLDTWSMFNGVFDGNNKTISNLKVTRDAGYGNGFFGNLPNGAVVKNVTFDNALVQRGNKAYSGNCYGIVAGYVYGSSSFENVHIINSELHGYGKVGPMIGHSAEPGNYVNSFANCSVTDTDVYGVYNVSGLVGLALQKIKVSMENVTVDVNFVRSENETYVDLTNAVATEATSGDTKEFSGNFWVYGQYLYAGIGTYYTDYEVGDYDYVLEDGRHIAHGETH